METTVLAQMSLPHGVAHTIKTFRIRNTAMQAGLIGVALQNPSCIYTSFGRVFQILYSANEWPLNKV